MNTSRAFGRIRFSGAVAASILALAAFSGVVYADDIKVTLSGSSEVPPVKTAAKGSGMIVINPDMSVSGSVTTTGVAATMAHIHQGAAGANGPVIIPLVKSGANTWSVPAGAKLTEAQDQAYKAGDLYVNVHSADHKGGEIRGQLK